MTKSVVIPKNLSQKGKDVLLDAGLNVIELTDLSSPAIISAAADVDGMILMTDPFDNFDIEKMPNLKIIARHDVGYDNVDSKFWGKQGVYVTITPNANASTVAETTMAVILDLSKDITKVSNEMRKGNFDYKNDHRGFNLEGQTLGIMGYGRIGRQVAQLAVAFSMNVIIYDPFVKNTEIGRLVTRDDIFKKSDVLTLHMAVTDENRQGIGKREFEMMKSSAMLVNQDDMLLALKGKRIAGAALDVLNEEPLPLTSAFYNLDNVLLTPHIASNTKNAMENMAVDSANEVVRTLNGEKPLWAVNTI
ncbi:MAG TPA: 3-phosphoglycerate dehydrogenase [Lactobacillus sp.]|nr:3-phosphoglycerate dehydrogenase [Lactobacillus sp.]